MEKQPSQQSIDERLQIDTNNILFRPDAEAVNEAQPEDTNAAESTNFTLPGVDSSSKELAFFKEAADSASALDAASKDPAKLSFAATSAGQQAAGAPHGDDVFTPLDFSTEATPPEASELDASARQPDEAAFHESDPFGSATGADQVASQSFDVDHDELQFDTVLDAAEDDVQDGFDFASP